MSEIHEAIEKAEGRRARRRLQQTDRAGDRDSGAVPGSFSETLGKGAQTEAITENIEASDLWAFFQAKDIRRTMVNVAADQTDLLAAGLTDPAAKAAIDKQIETWRKTAERYESDPKAGNGRKELEEHAKDAEEERDLVAGEISPLRAGVGGVPDRHRARLGGGDHRHGGAGLVRRRDSASSGSRSLALGVFAPHAVPFIASFRHPRARAASSGVVRAFVPAIAAAGRS